MTARTHGAVPHGVEFTLGVEEEQHLVDVVTRRLSPRAAEVLGVLHADDFTAELQRTTVELTTDVVTSLTALGDQLADRRRKVLAVTDQMGLAPAVAGTAPLSVADDFSLTESPRFAKMHDRYRLLVQEQLICGTQIHVGISDRNLAVEVMQRISRDLPVLCAMSASSPFLHGLDTGYASARTLLWQRWPSAGSAGTVANATAYDELLEDMIGTGVISDKKMAYFEVRLSSHAPTLELRVLDACPMIEDSVLIAGLFRALVREAAREIAAGAERRPVREPLHRAAMWQAARDGLAGDLLTADARPHPVPAKDAVTALVDRLLPDLDALGDVDQVTALTDRLLERGTSADRQRRVFARRQKLEDVVDDIVAETRASALSS